MPNWCETIITFESKKEWKLLKMKERLESQKDKNMSYGNMRYFDSIYDMKEYIIDTLNMDRDEFINLMKYAYKNLLSKNFLSLYCINKETLKNFFKTVNEYKTGEKELPKEDKNELVRMKALVEPNEMTKYFDSMPIETLLPIDKDNNKEVYEKYKLPTSYWKWTYENLGVKWDIDNYSDTVDIVYDPTSDLYKLQLAGNTAWTFPDNFVKKICKKYKICAEIKYYEPGVVFSGIAFVNKKGKLKYCTDIADDIYFNINSGREVRELDDASILEEEMDYYQWALEDCDDEELDDMRDRLIYLMDTTKDRQVEFDIRKELNITKKLFKNK